MDIDRLLTGIRPDLRADFRQFVETGEADAEFLAYLEQTPEAREALDQAFSEQARAFEDLARELRASEAAESTPTVQAGEMGAVLEAEPESFNQTLPVRAGGLRDKVIRLGFLLDLILAAVPLVACGIAIYALPLVPGLSWQAPWSPGIAGGAALAVVVIATVALGARSRLVAQALRWSGGALVGGTLVAAAALIVFLSLRADRFDATVSLAEYRLQDLVFASMDARQSSGLFPMASSTDQRVSFRTEHVSPEQGVYRAAARGVPGVYFADLRPDSGVLWWQDGPERDIRVRFVAGHVQEASGGRVLIQDLSGGGEYVDVHNTMASDTRVGAFIIAALDPKTGAVLKVQEVSSAPRP